MIFGGKKKMQAHNQPVTIKNNKAANLTKMNLSRKEKKNQKMLDIQTVG